MTDEKKLFYDSKDGIKLCGIIKKPKTVKSSALLVHGITMDKNEWDNFYVKFANQLSSNGIMSLRFDLRAHGESEGSQEDMTVSGCLLDVQASMDILSKEYPKGSVIIATSFGAGPAILYAASNKKKLKKLILLCPVLDYHSTFLKPLVPWAKDSFNSKGYKMLEEKGYLLLDEDYKIGAKLVEEFKVIKPYESLINEVKCPTLIIHGNKDGMVPYVISKNVSEKSKNISLLTINDADHGFVDSEDEEGTSPKSKENISNVIKTVISWICEK